MNKELGELEAWDVLGPMKPRKAEMYVGYKGQPCIDLGGMCSYIIPDLIENCGDSGEERFCIDLGGRNHRGHPVYVRRDELIKLARQGLEIWEAEHASNP